MRGGQAQGVFMIIDQWDGFLEGGYAHHYTTNTDDEMDFWIISF